MLKQTLVPTQYFWESDVSTAMLSFSRILKKPTATGFSKLTSLIHFLTVEEFRNFRESICTSIKIADLFRLRSPTFWVSGFLSHHWSISSSYGCLNLSLGSLYCIILPLGLGHLCTMILLSFSWASVFQNQWSKCFPNQSCASCLLWGAEKSHLLFFLFLMSLTCWFFLSVKCWDVSPI